MTISAVLITALLLFGTREKKLIPSKIQLMSEMLYNFIAKMISDTAGKKAKPYFPFIFSLFVFILFCNLIFSEYVNPKIVIKSEIIIAKIIM